MTAREIRLLHVAGARPNFMKVAPVMAAARKWSDSVPRGGVAFSQVLVHTGQHYDATMSEVFFRDLGLPRPDYDLKIGSGSHAAQAAAILERLEPVLLRERPDLVVVVGDVNSTLAATLCAAKLGFPVAHVEAGLRSFDRSMPEEINRVATDSVADLLFATEESAVVNLTHEGIAPERVHLVGNTMIDSLERFRATLGGESMLRRFGVQSQGYALVTLHRPSNVDDPERLECLMQTFDRLAARLPLIWPVHVRSLARLEDRCELVDPSGRAGVLRCAPLPYPEFLALMGEARLVLTDSGGVQEETTVLGVPCLTLRTSTERPVTVDEGTNRLVDPRDAQGIAAAVDEVLATPMPAAVRPPLWDGHAAERIVAVIADWSRVRRAPGGCDAHA